MKRTLVPWSLALLLLAPLTALAQPGPQPAAPRSAWQKLGGFAFEAGLASPATGPVGAVWFSADGGALFAQTVAGPVWQTQDFENWTPSTAVRPRPSAAGDLRAPEPDARVIPAPGGSSYSLGSNLFRSDDNGQAWTNLTGYNGRSVIGAGLNDLAVSPLDPQFIAVANAWGMWTSHDAGVTWSGLNDNLPNLQLSEIQPGPGGLRASVTGAGSFELVPGDSVWRPAGAAADLSARLSKTLNANITASAVSGDTGYAGASDGRIWVSRDRLATWTQSLAGAGGAVERISIDPIFPNVAYAAASGRSRSLLRTINAGQFWDDVTGNLAENPAHSMVADRSAGAIYVATDRGVFFARAELNALGPVPSWTAVSGLPDRAVRDVKISGTRLYAAVDGYGVYSRSTPQLTGAVRLVSAADLAERPAAPGALYSVVGQNVASVTSGQMRIPILSRGDDSAQIQVPFEATGSQLALSLDNRTWNLPLRAVSPAIFLDKDGAPMVLDAETGVMLEPRTSLHPRSRVQVLATGLGRTNPSWPTAVPAPAENPPAVAAAVQVFLDGVPLEVTSATLAPGYVGLYVVEFSIPVIVNAGAAELYLSAGGQESNRTRIYLQAQ